MNTSHLIIFSPPRRWENFFFSNSFKRKEDNKKNVCSIPSIVFRLKKEGDLMLTRVANSFYHASMTRLRIYMKIVKRQLLNTWRWEILAAYTCLPFKKKGEKEKKSRRMSSHWSLTHPRKEITIPKLKKRMRRLNWSRTEKKEINNQIEK